MWNLERVLGCIGGTLCIAAGWYKFGWAGIFLIIAMFCSCSIYFSGILASLDEDDEPEHDSCDGCKHNLECECREGSGYESWED